MPPKKRVDSTVDVNKAETKKAKNVNSKEIEVSQGSDKSEIQLVEKSVKARHEDEVIWIQISQLMRNFIQKIHLNRSQIQKCMLIFFIFSNLKTPWCIKENDALLNLLMHSILI